MKRILVYLNPERYKRGNCSRRGGWVIFSGTHCPHMLFENEKGLGACWLYEELAVARARAERLWFQMNLTFVAAVRKHIVWCCQRNWISSPCDGAHCVRITQNASYRECRVTSHSSPNVQLQIPRLGSISIRFNHWWRGLTVGFKVLLSQWTQKNIPVMIMMSEKATSPHVVMIIMSHMESVNR